MFYFIASNDDIDADKDYILPSADSNTNGNYILEGLYNVEHTNYSLVVGMYLITN